MYPESQVAIDEVKPALLETSAVFDAIICPYAPRLVKSYLYISTLLNKPISDTQI